MFLIYTMYLWLYTETYIIPWKKIYSQIKKIKLNNVFIALSFFISRKKFIQNLQLIQEPWLKVNKVWDIQSRNYIFISPKIWKKNLHFGPKRYQTFTCIKSLIYWSNSSRVWATWIIDTHIMINWILQVLNLN